MFTKGTYRVEVSHILEDGERTYGKTKLLTFREDDFTDGLLDLDAYEYEKRRHGASGSGYAGSHCG